MSLNKETARDYLMDDSDEEAAVGYDQTIDVHHQQSEIIGDPDRMLSKNISNENITSAGTHQLNCIPEVYHRVCPYVPCKAVCASEIDISRHILEFHITKVYMCSMCYRLFPCEVDMTNHYSSHSELVTIQAGWNCLQNTGVCEPLTPTQDTVHKSPETQNISGDSYNSGYEPSECTKPAEQFVYTCDTCTESFMREESLRLHVLKHTGDNPHEQLDSQSALSIDRLCQCPHCSNSYSHCQTLRVHVFYKHFDYVHSCLYYVTPAGEKRHLTWKDAQRFRCAHCLAPFARKSHKLKHDLITCKKINTHVCLQCSRRFSSSENLNKHNKLKICLFRPEDTPETKYQCHLCERHFCSKGELTQHKYNHTKLYKCSEPTCSKSFVKKAQLVVHKLCHSGAKPEKCNMCDAVFRYKGQLKQHQLSHLSKSLQSQLFQCLYCSKHYKFLYSLRSHVFQLHFNTNSRFLYFRHPSTNREYYLKPRDADIRCVKCNKRFASESTLARHTDEKHGSGSSSYSCNDCGTTFNSLWRLTQHKMSKIHNHNRHHMCHVCNKQFHTKAALSSHIVVHKAEKPFQCSACGKTFARRNQLQRHLLTHSRNRSHQCPVCGKTFAVVYDMRRHMNIHDTTRIKAFRCTHCDKGYDKKSQFVRHCETRHSCMLVSSQSSHAQT